MNQREHDASKECSGCRRVLPATAFNRRTNSADGRASQCRLCASARRNSGPSARGRDELRAAIKAGDYESFKELIASTSVALEKLLAIAVQNYSTAPKHAGHLPIVDFLIERGARPRCDMLLEAARDGNQALIEKLVAGGAELDIFSCSAIGGRERVANFLQREPGLARSHLPPSIVHYSGFTPLHCCCLSALGRTSPAKEGKFLEIARVLLGNGAELEATGTFYGALTVTPLDMLAHTGGNITLAQFLIQQGAKISGFAFLEAVSHRGRSMKAGLALAELFLGSGFDINSRAKEDGTALHACANSGNAESVRWLLKHGADMDALGRMGRTPLHLAAERNTSTKIAAMLVEAGADVTARDELGLTPLDVAEQHGKRAIADWLRAFPGRAT